MSEAERWQRIKEHTAKASRGELLFPVLAHVIGTFSGAALAAYLAGRAQVVHGLIVGGLFMLAGISVLFMIPVPWWVAALDLVLYPIAGWRGASMFVPPAGKSPARK